MSIKISELTSGTTLDGTEVLPIVQDGATVKITAQDVADLASSSGAVWGGITGDITDQTDLVTALNLKVDAVPGKGLSANDFTNTLKTKLDGIQDGAQVNVNADWNATSGDAQILNKPTIPATIGDMTKAVYDPNDTGIVLTASKEMVAVINKTGATITKGSIVYLKSSSSSGTHPEILLADADTEATSSKTLGATYEDILNDAVGYVVTSGEVDNLDTTAYNIGDKLWLSQTAGQVTTTPPTQPAHTVFIGTVTRSQNTNGRILYAIQNGYELGELHDVLLTTPANNDALVYESSSSLWKNKPILTGLGWFKIVDTTNSTPVTGTSETFLSATQLPTLTSGSLLKINCLRLTKGIVSASTIKGYINNVNNNLTGAVQIFTTASAFAQNSRIGTLVRTFKIVSGNIIGMSNATGLFTDNGANSNTVLNSALPSGTLYLIITAQNNLTGESTIQEILDISNF